MCNFFRVLFFANPSKKLSKPLQCIAQLICSFCQNGNIVLKLILQEKLTTKDLTDLLSASPAPISCATFFFKISNS